jgi:hypothetical protein
MASSAYDTQTAELLVQIARNIPRDIPSSIMQGWIENPRTLQRVLREALLPPEREFMFSAWKTVKVGLLESVNHALTQLKAMGVEVLDPEDEIFKSMSLETQERELDLVRIPLTALSLPEGYHSVADIHAAALKRGLEPCPAEVGLVLWLQYPAVLKPGDNATIAMEPVVGFSGMCGGFTLDNDSGVRLLVLGERHPDDERQSSEMERWIFVRPRT